MNDEARFSVTDAINSAILQTREHTDPEDPRAEASGSETLLGRYGLTSEDVEKPLQQYTVRAALPMLANGELDSAFLGIFLAGAIFADRVREEAVAPPAHPVGSIPTGELKHPICPRCGRRALERVAITVEDSTTGSTTFLKCQEGHRWDEESGALI